MAVFDDLPKREREILELVYKLGKATARQIQEALNDGTSYSAVRTFLSNLETKARINHIHEGITYLWEPKGKVEDEGALVLSEVSKTFFKGSREKTIAALLGSNQENISEEEYWKLRELIDKARGSNE